MTLQVVHIDERNLQRARQSFGETNAHEQGTHQSGTSREGDGSKLFLDDAGTLQRLVYHRNDILLMGARSQFWHDAAISLVYVLRCRDIAQQHSVA